MASDFKPGDVVQLKSGGPLMTIETIEEYDEGIKALCLWFDGLTRTNELFGLEVLKPAATH